MAQPVILPYNGLHPMLSDDVWLAENTAIIGDVHIGQGTNVWFQTTIRGDVNHIRIGTNTNIQDNSVCHVTTNKFPLHIGNDVTVGHGAILHGCTVEDRSLIGMGARVLDGAVVQSNAMVAAGALISPGKVVKSGQLWAGVPAKYIRELTEDERSYILWSSAHYVRLAKNYS